MATSSYWLSKCHGEITPFGRAVDRLLESWTALRLIVDHHAAGADTAEKAKWLVYAIEQWFKDNKDIKEYEMTDFLEEVFENDFEDVVIGDSSIPQIAREICLFYRLCSEGQMAELEAKLQKLPKAAVNNCVTVSQDEEMDVVEEGDVSEPDQQQSLQQQQPPQERPARNGPDEDGWETVPVRGKGRRK